MRYIGLDVGTSGCKASVTDREGTVFMSARREYAPVSPLPGYVEIDARIVLDSVMQVLSEVAGPDITALSIASFGEAVVLLSGKDKVLGSSIYYSDVRGIDEVADILDAMDPAICRKITGTRANPMFSANKLLWIKKHQPELLRDAKRTMLFGDYIAYMLTGERVIDYSLASRTMLFDIRNNCWSTEVIEALDLPAGGFSAPVRMGTPIGKLLKSVANELRLSENVLVVAGGHDQTVAALGGGATNIGDSVDGIGSTECISLVLGTRDISEAMVDYNFCVEPYAFDDTYLTLAFNASAGSAIRWFRDCFHVGRAAGEAGLSGNIYQIMERDCPPEPTEILFLPFVAGSGTPFLDAEIGGAFIGLRLGATQEEMYRAVLQGICFEMQYNVQLLSRCGVTLETVTAVGGGVQSELMMQIKSDVMRRDISVLGTPESGTVALALLCANVMGDICDIKESARRAAKKVKTYVPNPEFTDMYASLMDRYCRIYPAIREIYQERNHLC